MAKTLRSADQQTGWHKFRTQVSLGWNMGNSATDLCNICYKSPEAIKNLYWECPGNRQFWKHS